MRPNISLKQLYYLSLLAETLNFTRAAEACFVTQSTLSASLKDLETTLGTTLVERDRQNVLFTPLGQAFVARARDVLAAAHDLSAMAAASRAPMTGLLRLGVIPTIAPFLLPRTLPSMREAYPDLKLALREDLTASLLDRLRAGRLDLAIIALPYDTAGLLVRELFADELWLAGRPDDPALKTKRVALGTTISDRLLLLEEGHCLREHALAACPAEAGAATEQIEATSLLTLLEMVESGLGLALLPEMAIAAGLLNQTTLIAKPLAPPVPKRTIALVARPSTAKLAERDALADMLIADRRARERAVLTSHTRTRTMLPASRIARAR